MDTPAKLLMCFQSVFAAVRSFVGLPQAAQDRFDSFVSLIMTSATASNWVTTP